mgnify:CR=1 FL=1
MQPAHEIFAIADLFQRLFTHSGRYPHADSDINRVGQLNASSSVRRIRMPHHVWQNIHRPTFHTTFCQVHQRFFCFLRVHPVIVRTLRFSVRVENKCQMLCPSDICWVASVKVRVWPKFVVQFVKHSLVPNPFFFKPISTSCCASSSEPSHEPSH